MAKDVPVFAFARTCPKESGRLKKGRQIKANTAERKGKASERLSAFGAPTGCGVMAHGMKAPRPKEHRRELWRAKEKTRTRNPCWEL
eukprot:g9158.t1